jgi:hypothetical protein
MFIRDPHDIQVQPYRYQYQQLGGERSTYEPTPSADEAVKSMRRRADVLRNELAQVEAKRAELAKLERMIAAAAEEPADGLIAVPHTDVP